MRTHESFEVSMLGFGKVARVFDPVRSMHVWTYDDDPSRTFELHESEIVDPDAAVARLLVWLDECDDGDE